MAGTKIRGITIELGADTSGLSKALKGVNTEIKSTQKQLKDVERLLKLDPTNTELLEQKQRLLADQVGQTAKKLDALKEAQKQVGEELKKTGEGQEQYDALTREIAATEQELKQAEKAASSFNVTTEKISASAQKLSGKFSTVANKTRALSAAAGGLLAALGGLAIKTAQNADELNTLSKQTGVSTKELQKMQYAADQIDVDPDTIIGGMKKLKKAVASGSDAFEKLGVKTKDLNGEYRDIEDVFYAVVRRLSEIPNETERDIVAMELFGKSADELAGLIDDGGEALKALGEEAESLGVIIPQEDIDKANELNDALDKMKAEMAGTFAQIGTELAEMLLPYLPDIKEKFEGILQALRDMDPDKLAFGVKCAAIVAALSPIATTAAACTTAIGNLSSALSTAGGALGMSGGVFAIVIAGIMAFVAAVGLAVGKTQEFEIAWGEAWQKVSSIFDTVANFIRDKLGALGERIAWAIDNIQNIFRSFLNFMKGLTETVAGLLTGNWDRMLNGMKLALLGFVDETLNIFASFVNGFIGGINAVIQKINDLLNVDIGKIPILNADFSGKFAGGLASGGTISSGSSAIVGEAGAEILTVSGGSATVTPLGGGSSDRGVVGLLETYLPYLASGNTIVMDSGALVGSIAPDMNAALGTIAIRGGHR